NPAARSRAVLRDITDPRRGATLGRRRREGVPRTVVVDAVAALGDVAHACRRAADGRALGVGRTGGARSRAVLREIADAGRGAALAARRLEGVRRAVVAHAV